MKKLTFTTIPFSTKLFATGATATGASLFADFFGIFSDKFILYIAIIAMFIGALSYFNSIEKGTKRAVTVHTKLILQFMFYSFLVLAGSFLALKEILENAFTPNTANNVAGFLAMALSYNADKLIPSVILKAKDFIGNAK